MFVLRKEYLCLALGLIASATIAAGSGEYRIFTDQQGREINAKIIKIKPGGKITVERDNRRIVTVSSNIFSEADQDYIREWAAVGQFQAKNKFQISAKQEKKKTGDNETSISYSVKLDNRTDMSIDDVKVEYCMFIKISGFNGSKNSERIVTGRLNFGHLDTGNKKEVKTPVERLRITQKSYTYQETETLPNSPVTYTYTKTGYKKSTEDKLKGFWVKVYGPTVGGQQITREYCTPSGTDKKYVWPTREFSK